MCPFIYQHVLGVTLRGISDPRTVEQNQQIQTTFSTCRSLFKTLHVSTAAIHVLLYGKIVCHWCSSGHEYWLIQNAAHGP